MTTVRSNPCTGCPYRKDVSSGVWVHDEYEKLREYDAPTGEQPLAGFRCHATPEHYCNGWAVVHTSRGHEFDLLALRFHGYPEIPETSIPLWSSGNEAADWGQADVSDPDYDAIELIERLRRKYAHLNPPEDR